MSVPALRFPEFSGEWEETQLGDVSRFKKGKGISKADIVEGGALPCVRYGELYTTYGRLIENVVSFTNVPIGELVVSDGGEILIPASGESSWDIATAAVLPYGGVAIGGDLNVVDTNQDRFFVATYLSGKGKKHLARMAQGNSVVHLYKNQIASASINLPSLPEQNKIATFLVVVDEKLAALRARRAGLEAYKRGLMQKLFSRTLRFTKPDGSTFPDWEEKRLGEISTKNDSGIYKNRELYGSGHNIVGVADLFKIHAIDGQTFREVPLAEEELAKNSLLEGDILYAESSLVRAGIAKAVYVTSKGAGTAFAWHTRRFSVNPTAANSAFVFYYLECPIARKFIESVATQTALTGITTKDYFKTPILLPHLDEQRLIADALQAMDAKIEAVTDQITRMEAFKTGLLQQMFV